MVSIDNQVIISGGSEDDIDGQNTLYKLECVTPDCTWQSMAPLQLSVARYGHVAVAVPDNFVNCP